MSLFPNETTTMNVTVYCTRWQHVPHIIYDMCTAQVCTVGRSHLVPLVLSHPGGSPACCSQPTAVLPPECCRTSPVGTSAGLSCWGWGSWPPKCPRLLQTAAADQRLKKNNFIFKSINFFKIVLIVLKLKEFFFLQLVVFLSPPHLCADFAFLHLNV